MLTSVFNEHVQETHSMIEATLCRKADEYARGDQLSNFHKAAATLACTPERACLGFVTKHWIALIDFIADLDAGKVQTMDRWDEKILDIMAYMVLLRALIKERTNNTDGDLRLTEDKTWGKPC